MAGVGVGMGAGCPPDVASDGCWTGAAAAEEDGGRQIEAPAGGRGVAVGRDGTGAEGALVVSTWPTRIRSDRRPFQSFRLRTLTPQRRAIFERVSPGCTT